MLVLSEAEVGKVGWLVSGLGEFGKGVVVDYLTLVYKRASASGSVYTSGELSWVVSKSK
jgi:hypothetical protein